MPSAQNAAAPCAKSPAVFYPSIALTDEGLVCGAGSILVRMSMDARGRPRLALDTDEGRLLAMLSAAFNRPVAASDVLHHVDAAAHHWRRGDKGLANIRLIVARFPRLRDPVGVERLRLAEYVLDKGVSSDALMKELGFGPKPSGFQKYREDQPRVPAGHGRESGQWDNGIVVAQEDEDPPERDLPFPQHDTFEHDATAGRATGHHLHLLDPFTQFPAGSGATSSTLDQLSAAAKAAADAMGPGRGPVYGTKVHTEFKARVDALGRSDLLTEESYKHQLPVKRGTPGSIRTDAIEGPKEKPTTVYDLKTGSASLTNSRIEEIRKHLPSGSDIEIFEVKP